MMSEYVVARSMSTIRKCPLWLNMDFLPFHSQIYVWQVDGCEIYFHLKLKD
jgi:hypothetical protein